YLSLIRAILTIPFISFFGYWLTRDYDNTAVSVYLDPGNLDARGCNGLQCSRDISLPECETAACHPITNDRGPAFWPAANRGLNGPRARSAPPWCDRLSIRVFTLLATAGLNLPDCLPNCLMLRQGPFGMPVWKNPADFA